jgi:hypothetical protein
MAPEHAGPAAVFREYDLGAEVPQYMVRTQQYKYIHNDGEIDELHDWEAEPGEVVNRAQESAMNQLFAGSAILEARCKAAIGCRWKQSGRHSQFRAVTGSIL